MDLQLFVHITRRFWPLVMGGLLVAATLGLLSYARIDFGGGSPTLSYRAKEQWAAHTRLLVTAPGFKWGSSLTTNTDGTDVAVEGRLPNLATVYSSFVTSDAVMAIMRESGKIRGKVQATPLPSANGNQILPIVDIVGISFTARSAAELANRAGSALATYVDRQQIANRVASRERIQLRVLNAAGSSGTIELLAPRGKTLPILVFAAIMFATFSLALVLENMRPGALQVVSNSEPSAQPRPKRATL